MTVSVLISAVLQVTLFTSIPFLVWLILERKKESFFKWLGFKAPVIEKKAKFCVLFAGSFILFTISAMFVHTFFIGKDTVAASQFYGMGVAGIIPALLYAFIQTGLSEEIVFRGFIGKRAIKAWGFKAGNSVQALLFGLVHGVMFFPTAGIFAALITVVFTGIVGAVMGYLNEKTAGGSILPSWMLHGLANLASAVLMMFGVIS